MTDETNIIKAVETIVDEKTRNLATKNELVSFKDELLTVIDTNNKKLDRILTEHPAMNGAIDANRSMLQNHENRIHQIMQKLD